MIRGDCSFQQARKSVVDSSDCQIARPLPSLRGEAASDLSTPIAANVVAFWPTSHLIRVPEAARITGLPSSLLRKSFICESKRPRNIPPPPPHKRIGRSVYIVASELHAWIQSLGGSSSMAQMHAKPNRGRPTVGARIAGVRSASI
jgi:predicted DNA-binding transcriptional regulator AlpA